MRILHLCLAAYYIDGYAYQENIFPRLHKEAGNEVLIIASTETFVDNRNLGYLQPSEYMTEYGVLIKRLPYARIFCQRISAKLRKYPSLYNEIESFQPDVIMAHDLCFMSAYDLSRYMKKHSEVKLYADTHTASYNSGKNWVSLHILHRCFYKWCIHTCLPYVERYFYIGRSEQEFSRIHYGIPEEKMEYLPLGGCIPEKQWYLAKREQRRHELEINEDELLFVHSGKMDALKKTEDLLRAFIAVPELKVKLAIIGSISEEMKETLLTLINSDSRIVFLGWKSSEELREYLCASDLYLQPGSVSATLQSAVCCGRPVLTYPHYTYVDYGYDCFIWAENRTQIESAFRKIANQEIDLDSLSENAEKCARELLDYKKQAERICQ